MNGSMVNDRLVKGGQSIALQSGDIITFGQNPQQFLFEYEGVQSMSPSIKLKDEKISLVNKFKPTYAKIDHLANPVQPGKAAAIVILIHSYRLVLSTNYRDKQRRRDS